MKVYIVHTAVAISLVTTDRAEAEKRMISGLRYSSRDEDGPTEFRPAPGTQDWIGPQENLHFISNVTGRWNRSPDILTTVELSTGSAAASPDKDFREHWADRFEEECGNHGRANGPGLIMAAHLMCPERSGWGATQDTAECVVPYHTHTGGDGDTWLTTCRREPPED